MNWSVLTLFLLITARMTGFVLFNPLFGRRGIPGMVKAGLILMLSLTVYSAAPGQQVQMPSTLLGLALIFLLELGLGYILGLIVNIFFYIPLMAGSVIDMEMGLAMASTYDPGSGSKVTATSTLLNVLMTLLFFAANGHLTLIRILLRSGGLVPYGGVTPGPELYSTVMDIFVNCTVLGVKLCMPILAAELMGQVGMGIIMKAIPQINVFVINIEVKVIVGLVLILILMTPFSEFLLSVETEMLYAVERALSLM